MKEKIIAQSFFKIFQWEAGDGVKTASFWYKQMQLKNVKQTAKIVFILT